MNVQKEGLVAVIAPYADLMLRKAFESHTV